MSKIYKTWLNRVASGQVTHGQIRQLCEAIYPLAWGQPPGGKRTNLTEEEAWQIVDLIATKGGLPVGERQAAIGRRWLATNAKRHNMPAVLADPANIDRFTFVGPGDDLEPVYRVTLRDGRQIDYSVRSWQSIRWGGGHRVRWGWAPPLSKGA
jgi:hypothetical protein